MDRTELLGKISAFPLLSAALAEDLLSGDYRSVFKGQGIEFDEVRRYEQGDDARSIDRNVSARFGAPYVKLYREERELTVALALDCSASMRAGGRLSRYEQGILAAALVAFSAERAGQRVGGVFFDREIRRVFPPRKGRSHVMALISAALGLSPDRRGSELGKALGGLGRLLKRRGLVVLISDFHALTWEWELGDLARRHDVIALRIREPLDRELPPLGLLSLADPETGAVVQAPTDSASFREAWGSWQRERSRLWESICRRSGAARLELSTGEDAASALLRFFSGRKNPSRRVRGPLGQRPV
jgi:uncharacterized protein (DUF58 family)